MSIKAIIFDLGGVLVHTTDRSAHQKWERYLGIKDGDLPKLVVETEESALAVQGKLNEGEAWNVIAKKFSLSKSQLKQFRRDYYFGDQIDHKLVKFVAGLRPRFKTAILTNAWCGARKQFESQFSLSKIVDDVIYSAEIGFAKPDPLIFRLALERLGVDGRQTIFVDDKEENVQAARQENMFAVRFSSTDLIIRELNLTLQTRS